MPALIKINKNCPKSFPGKKTESPKNPFQILMKIGRDHHPQTGQMAIISEMTLMTPTTAPMGTSLGLYSSISDVPEILGMTKVAKSMMVTMIVYPAMLI